MLADNGYDSEDNRQELAEKDIELICPPAGQSPDGFGIIDFKISDNGKQILECPMGQKCLKKHVKFKDKNIFHFSLKICQSCQHLNDCTVKLNKRKAVLTWTWNNPKIEICRLMFEQDQFLFTASTQD